LSLPTTSIRIHTSRFHSTYVIDAQVSQIPIRGAFLHAVNVVFSTFWDASVVPVFLAAA
jgi:hypothetical protein